jgi:hypothetical protein
MSPRPTPKKRIILERFLALRNDDGGFFSLSSWSHQLDAEPIITTQDRESNPIDGTRQHASKGIP